MNIGLNLTLTTTMFITSIDMAHSSAKIPQGRGTTYDEPLSERVQVLFTTKQRNDLEKKLGSKDLSSWIRRVVLGEEEAPVPSIVNLTNIVTSLKFMTAAPCGDFEEAVEHAGQFMLSKDVADFLGATATDVIVRAMNTSMEGAGIFDGQLLLMEPLGVHALPRRGDIALIQIHRSGGEVEGTIKRWDKSGLPPRLLNGDGEEITYPDDLVKVEAIAVAKGIIGRI